MLGNSDAGLEIAENTSSPLDSCALLPAEPLIADKGHRHSLRSRVASQLGVANKDLIAYLTEEELEIIGRCARNIRRYAEDQKEAAIFGLKAFLWDSNIKTY